MRWALVIALLVVAPASASAERWWAQFYGTVGHRDVVGVDRASGTSFSLGYRFERPRWGIDARVLNVQYELDEGVHTLARIGGYGQVRRGWIGAGIGVGSTKGWVTTGLPKRQGNGTQVHATAGYELLRLGFARAFVQADVTVPLYRLYDLHRSGDSMTYVVAVETSVGLRF